MTDTQVLLQRIAALRQRLAEAQQAESKNEKTVKTVSIHHLQHHVHQGRHDTDLLDATLRPLHDDDAGEARPVLPARLISRSSLLLTRGRQLLQALRALTDDPFLPQDRDEPLAALFHETVYMIDTVLRTVQAFPPSPSSQIRLCAGLEGSLSVVSERLGVISAALQHRRTIQQQTDNLAGLLHDIRQGHSISYDAFQPMIEAISDAADHSRPMHFARYGGSSSAQIVACHSLTVARVVARVTRGQSQWRERRSEAILAALVHDVGMVSIPPEVLLQSGPLDDGQRRQVERHTLIGSELLERMRPLRRWLIEATAAHHERDDGTGYPMGVNAESIPPMAKLLAVCDVYAAMCCDRPYRAACEPRSALTDVLVLADQGALDRFQAEHLFELSFYPVGSVVELDDGSVGIVIDTHSPQQPGYSPARPVLIILIDDQGLPAAIPYRLDLARCRERSVLRTLSAAVRRDLIGKHFPEMV